MYPLRDDPITVHIPTNTQATDMIAFIAPYECEVVSVEARHRTASSSGTLMLEKTPDGTAVGSGTNILTGTMSLAGTVNTKVTGTLDTGIGVNRIVQGAGIGLDFAGTLSSLADLDITIVVRQVKKR
jgi:hypothetical protein